MDQFRPFPPSNLIDQAEEEEAIRLAPAVDLKEWVVKNWLTIGGELHNPDHDHIAELLHDDENFLAFAWASSAAVAKKRMVLGQCEKVMFNQGGWKKARQEQQMRDWFGFVPVYLITVDAAFCEQTSDREFCRLIEHELYHIGVERDADGEIIYSDHTGLFNEARKEYIEQPLHNIEGANDIVQLKILSDLLVSKKGNVVMVIKLIDQMQKIVKGHYEKKIEITGKDGGPLQTTTIQATKEQVNEAVRKAQEEY